MKLYLDDVRDAGKEKGGMLDRRDARKEGCRTRERQGRRDAGKERCMKGCVWISGFWRIYS